MIKNPTPTKLLSFGYRHTTIEAVTIAQVIADPEYVTIAYLNEAGSVLDVAHYRTAEHPELKDIVQVCTFDDVWDIDMVMSLIEPVDTDEQVKPVSAPEWHYMPWQPEGKPDFRNLPMQAAS